MPPKTVQQLFGLKPEEVNALAVTAGLEGFRGAGGKDVAAVAANLLNRRLHGGWGGRDIRNIATSPGQYAAILDRGLSMRDLADPAVGARLLGGAKQFEEVRNIVNNPQLVGGEFRNLKGAQSFKGTSLYKNRRPEDYTPVPGKSNFYHGTNPDVYQRGLKIFEGVPAQATTPQAPSITQTPKDRGNQLGTSLLQRVMGMIPSLVPQRQSSLLPVTTPELSGQSFLDTYRMFFDDELV